MALLNETNAQYYSGQQVFPSVSGHPLGTDLTLSGWSFNIDPVSAYGLPIVGITPNRSLTQISSNSYFEVYFAPTSTPATYTKINEDLVYISGSKNNEVTIIAPDTTNTDYNGNWYIQMKQSYIWQNYGSYEYISITDIVNNFMLAYVGMDKLIPRVKRSDVIFHAKRGLQEFSYDTLKSIKSQELTIPPSLSVPIPQDYVNYVRCSWIDDGGVKHIIYPVNNLTISPTDLPLQDVDGIPTQNSFGENNVADQSEVVERWNTQDVNDISGLVDFENVNVYNWTWWKQGYGERYGLEPQLSQQNGWFQIDERRGKFSFSSDLANKLIVIEYISDGLAYDMDSKVPKLAEDALYAHISYSILASKANTQEYIVQRFKKDRYAKLRNAKIRLSNIKLSEITQVFRGKSKWIKH